MTGHLAITFDDRHIDSWLSARSLFDAVDARVRSGMRALLSNEHSVGSHGARHRNADEIIADGDSLVDPRDVHLVTVDGVAILDLPADTAGDHR
jgi:hypothetical protein